MSAKLSIQPFHPSSLMLDGQVIRIRVARLDVDAFTAFRRDYERVEQSEIDRALAIRQDGEEQEKHQVPRPRTDAEAAAATVLDTVRSRLSDDEHAALAALLPAEPSVEKFVISDAEIARRRLDEMTPDERTAHQAKADKADTFKADFLRRAVTEHITIEAGEIEIDVHDGKGPRALTSGEEFARYFGGRRDLMEGLAHSVMVENGMDETLKNVFRSLLGSGGSSAERDPAAVGGKPEPTAASAEIEASAEPVGATA